MYRPGILPSSPLVTTFCLLITCAEYLTPAISAPPANPGKPPPLTPAVCEAGLSVTTTQMDFGTYTDGTGTIIMDVTGNLTHSIGLMPVPSSATVGTPAAFALVQNVPQCKNRAVIFTMPAQFDMSSGGSIVTIDDLSNDLPGATFTVGNGITIMMGGRLNATAGDALGTYNGVFNVTFEYLPF